eukprot:7073086-Karenia_brevis.AAC.1
MAAGQVTIPGTVAGWPTLPGHGSEASETATGRGQPGPGPGTGNPEGDGGRAVWALSTCPA